MERNRRILIITYYWYPAGGPGVQRILKFAKYLSKLNWELIVLTVKNGNFPARDESMATEIPQNIRIFKSNAIEPFKLYNIMQGKKPQEDINTNVLSSNKKEKLSTRLFKWIRANIFIPDARCGWIPSLYLNGIKLIRQYQPALIFSSSPPHSLLLGAALLSQKTGIPLVADLRDPWADAFWLKSLKRTKLSWLIDRKMEKYSLDKAERIITVSEGVKDIFKKLTARPIEVIHNGYDEADFDKAEPAVHDKFVICHTGNIRAPQFSPAFFDSISGLPQHILDDIEIHLFGNVQEQVKDYIAGSSASGCFKLHGYVSHDRVINEIKGAQLLVVFSPNVANSKGILTAKIFEYIYSGKYIIAYGTQGNEIKNILDETETGSFFLYGESSADKILKIYDLWKKGQLPEFGNSYTGNYSRRKQTAKLSSIFEEII